MHYAKFAALLPPNLPPNRIRCLKRRNESLLKQTHLSFSLLPAGFPAVADAEFDAAESGLSPNRIRCLRRRNESLLKQTHLSFSLLSAGFPAVVDAEFDSAESGLPLPCRRLMDLLIIFCRTFGNRSDAADVAILTRTTNVPARRGGKLPAANLRGIARQVFKSGFQALRHLRLFSFGNDAGVLLNWAAHFVVRPLRTSRLLVAQYDLLRRQRIKRQLKVRALDDLLPALIVAGFVVEHRETRRAVFVRRQTVNAVNFSLHEHLLLPASNPERFVVAAHTVGLLKAQGNVSRCREGRFVRQQ